MLTASIRWRLQIWLAFLLVGLLTAFGVASWQWEKTERVRRLDDELSKRAVALGVGIRGGPRMTPPGGPARWPRGPSGRERDREMWDARGSGRRPPPPPDPGPLDDVWDRPEKMIGRDKPVPEYVKAMFPAQDPTGYYYVVWTGMDAKVEKSPNAPEVPRPVPLERDTQTHLRERDGMREAYHFTERGECVLAGRPLGTDLAAMRPLAWRLSLAGAAVLALGLGGGWLLTTRSIRPIEQIADTAQRISEGNLSERIPLTEPGGELGKLAGVLNTTFARLEESFVQQKRFTADASHELRTPLAVLIAETQTALSRERSAEEYREVLAGNLDTARQMKRLAEALLELARLDGGQEDPAPQPYDLAEGAAMAGERLRGLAGNAGIALEMHLEEAPVSGHPDRMTLVAANLIENAIHYGRDGGHVIVRTAVVGGCAELSVEDDGCGIDEADLPHLFERFYRADRSRSHSRAGGRYGLGLAICQGVVEMEGGEIAVRSVPGQGSTFTVRLPLAAD